MIIAALIRLISSLFGDRDQDAGSSPAATSRRPRRARRV
jgi:hypothetical protein